MKSMRIRTDDQVMLTNEQIHAVVAYERSL